MRHSQFFRSATFFLLPYISSFFLGCNVSLAKGPASKHIPGSTHFTGVCVFILRRQARREIDYFCIIHKNYRITSSFFFAHVILETKQARKGGPGFYEEEEITLRLGAWRHISRRRWVAMIDGMGHS
ncbi:hypothetical protein F5Y13DRAFT_46792 [Hypoxylon sp. FL1857]|nr:hypothetical protein F5Y13DRAFT_46792 [Hypoxylon sp. FL1857]